MRIRIENLNKIYPGGKKALDNLNLTIEPGMFGLLGPNGAGKTSLMRIMTLLQSPTSGTIFFDDYDIAKDRKAIRSVLGYLPQDFRFFEKLKTWEFLDYGAGLAGIKGKAHREEVVDEMLRKVGLFEVRDRWANRLSGGMKQKLALSCALIHRPRILLLDEPTTGVDAVSRSEFWDVLATLKEKGITILVSTSYMDEAERCERIALINKGKILDVDTPERLVDGVDKNLYNAAADSMYPLLEALRGLSGVIVC